MSQILTTIGGKLRIDRSRGGALVLSDDSSEDGPCCCGCEVLKITYDWIGTGQADLDTGTKFLGVTVGFACGGSGPYISWSGDNTSASASEYVLIYFKDALKAGYWNTSTKVNLAAGWFTRTPQGSGPAKVIVECYNVTNEKTKKEKTINPGQQGGCAATNVGEVTIYEDGTFELT